MQINKSSNFLMPSLLAFALFISTALPVRSEPRFICWVTLGLGCKKSNESVAINPARSPNQSTINRHSPTLENNAFLNLDSLVQLHPEFESPEKNGLIIYGYALVSESSGGSTVLDFKAVESLVAGGYYYYPFSGQSSNFSLGYAFNILPSSETARITEQVKAVQSMGLKDPDREAIAIAMIYLDYQPSNCNLESFGLNSLALQILDERIKTGSENLQIYLLKAQAYYAMGLMDEAKQSYEKVLSLAEKTNKLDYEAESYLWLGNLARLKLSGSSDKTEVISHWQKASALYQNLGDQDQVEALQTKIEKLSRSQ